MKLSISAAAVLLAACASTAPISKLSPSFLDPHPGNTTEQLSAFEYITSNTTAYHVGLDACIKELSQANNETRAKLDVKTDLDLLHACKSIFAQIYEDARATREHQSDHRNSFGHARVSSMPNHIYYNTTSKVIEKRKDELSAWDKTKAYEEERKNPRYKADPGYRGVIDKVYSGEEPDWLKPISKDEKNDVMIAVLDRRSAEERSQEAAAYIAKVQARYEPDQIYEALRKWHEMHPNDDPFYLEADIWRRGDDHDALPGNLRHRLSARWVEKWIPPHGYLPKYIREVCRDRRYQDPDYHPYGLTHERIRKLCELNSHQDPAYINSVLYDVPKGDYYDNLPTIMRYKQRSAANNTTPPKTLMDTRRPRIDDSKANYNFTLPAWLVKAEAEARKHPPPVDGLEGVGYPPFDKRSSPGKIKSPKQQVEKLPSEKQTGLTHEEAARQWQRTIGRWWRKSFDYLTKRSAPKDIINQIRPRGYPMDYNTMARNGEKRVEECVKAYQPFNATVPLVVVENDLKQCLQNAQMIRTQDMLAIEDNDPVWYAFSWVDDNQKLWPIEMAEALQSPRADIADELLRVELEKCRRRELEKHSARTKQRLKLLGQKSFYDCVHRNAREYAFDLKDIQFDEDTRKKVWTSEDPTKEVSALDRQLEPVLKPSPLDRRSMPSDPDTSRKQKLNKIHEKFSNSLKKCDSHLTSNSTQDVQIRKGKFSFCVQNDSALHANELAHFIFEETPLARLGYLPAHYQNFPLTSQAKIFDVLSRQVSKCHEQVFGRLDRMPIPILSRSVLDFQWCTRTAADKYIKRIDETKGFSAQTRDTEIPAAEFVVEERAFIRTPPGGAGLRTRNRRALMEILASQLVDLHPNNPNILARENEFRGLVQDCTRARAPYDSNSTTFSNCIVSKTSAFADDVISVEHNNFNMMSNILNLTGRPETLWLAAREEAYGEFKGDTQNCISRSANLTLTSTITSGKVTNRYQTGAFENCVIDAFHVFENRVEIIDDVFSTGPLPSDIFETNKTNTIVVLQPREAKPPLSKMKAEDAIHDPRDAPQSAPSKIRKPDLLPPVVRRESEPLQPRRRRTRRERGEQR